MKPGTKSELKPGAWSKGRAVVVALVAVWIGGGVAVGNAQQAKSMDTSLVLDGVTVIDVERGTLASAQRVVVTGDRIRAVGDARKVRRPAGARIVDARGQYLIPGLWDMHAHVDAKAARLYPRFIAHGVTGVREMAQHFAHGADSFHVWQREIMAGRRIGPRGVGPSADVVAGVGVSTYGVSFGVGDPGVVDIATAEDAERVVDSLKAAGMAFVKFHDDLMPPSLYFALLRAARRAGMPVVGHTPLQEVSDVAIADSGQRSVEHINEIRCWFPIAPRDSVAEQACAAAAATAFRRRGTWLVPTFVAFAPPDPAADPTDRGDYLREQYRRGQRLVRLLRTLGVTHWLAGTDQTDDETQAGATLLAELGHLVEAGFTPLEAIQAATLNPARFFEATDSLGTIAPGKLADLVLLEANPLDAITNVTKVRAVIANGRYFDRVALDRLLAPVSSQERRGR